MDPSYGFLFDATTTLDAADGDASESWVQIAKTGTFQDPRYGEFRITLSDFQKWQRNFKGLVLDKGRLGLPADRDHEPEKKGETEAVGWVKELEQRGDEMWARVLWNDLGAELIKTKRYAYISPSYTDHYKDEHGVDHGKALVGIALTNRPFLQMATVNLSQFTFARTSKAPNAGDDVGLDPDDITDLSSYCLGDPAAPGPISPEQRAQHAVIRKTINGKHRDMFPIPPGDRFHAGLAKAFVGRAVAAGHITESEAAEIRARANDVLGGKSGKQHSAYSHRQMDVNTLLTSLELDRKTLGVADDADDATVLAAIKTHMAKPAAPPAAPEGQVTLSAEAITKLLADAAAGRQAANELVASKFETAFLAAQKDGKVTLGQRETFEKLYEANADLTLKTLSELPAVIPMSPMGAGATPADLDPQARTLATEYSDSVTPRTIDPEGLKILAQAEAIEAAKNVPFERALEMAYAGVTV